MNGIGKHPNAAIIDPKTAIGIILFDSYPPSLFVMYPLAIDPNTGAVMQVNTKYQKISAFVAPRTFSR